MATALTARSFLVGDSGIQRSIGTIGLDCDISNVAVATSVCDREGNRMRGTAVGVRTAYLRNNYQWKATA